MTRVWLTRWEWSCCGKPFRVGDDVDFGIQTRTPDPTLTEILGSALASTVNAMESHHEEEFTDRVVGRVAAVHAVTHEVTERRSERSRGHRVSGTGDTASGDGEQQRVRWSVADGAYAEARPSPYVTEVIPVPDSAALVPVPGVPWPPADRRDGDSTPAERDDGPPSEQRKRSLAGWLVDVDERSTTTAFDG